MIPIDLDLHEKTLRDFLGPDQEPILQHALQRMEVGRLKWEKPVLDHSNRDFMKEGLEELIDGLNRLVMEYNRRKAEGRVRLQPYLAAQLVQRAIMILTGAAFEERG